MSGPGRFALTDHPDLSVSVGKGDSMFTRFAFLLVSTITLHAAVAAPATGQARRSDQDLIQGGWKVVKLQSDGREKKPEIPLRITFTGDSATMVEGDSTFELKFKIDPAARPKTIDLTML